MARAGVLLLVLVLAVPAAYATNYRVGDNTGWDTGNNYATWTSGKTFVVGDTLQFVYGSTHTVDVVNQSGYDGCSASNAINNYSGGNTTIPLTTTGAHYFLCGVSNHCSLGMKLSVTVSASGSPAPGGSTSPPPPPPPSGRNNGAKTSFSGVNLLLLGASLVLAPLLGLMG